MVDLHELTIANAWRWQNWHAIRSLVLHCSATAERLVCAKQGVLWTVIAVID